MSAVFTLGAIDIAVCTVMALNPGLTTLWRATRTSSLGTEPQTREQMTRRSAPNRRDSLASKTGSSATEPEMFDRK